MWGSDQYFPRSEHLRVVIGVPLSTAWFGRLLDQALTRHDPRHRRRGERSQQIYRPGSDPSLESAVWQSLDAKGVNHSVTQRSFSRAHAEACAADLAYDTSAIR